MTEETGYNGWSNYETWSVALIIDNDEAMQRFALDLTRIAVDEGEPSEYWSEEERRRYRTADALKEWVEENCEIPTTDLRPFQYLWAQLIGAALSEVDWYELADHYIGELAEA